MLNKFELFCKRVADSHTFNGVSLVVILLSAIILGIETNLHLYTKFRDIFFIFDSIFLGYFTFEILVKLLSNISYPSRYFRDGWNLFDATIVVLCYLPVGGQFAAVARLLRVLRALRLITHVPQLRLIVETMMRSISSLGYIALLLGLVFYVYAVIAVFSFGSINPENFGSLARAFLTLFQVVTLEGWVEIMKQVSNHHPIFAPLYFVSFIIFGTMIVLNLFIGVIVNSLSEAQEQQRKIN